MREKRLIEQELEREKREKEILEQENRQFYDEYPNLKHHGLNRAIPRAEILRMLFDLKYKENYNSKKEFREAMITVIRDKLLEELNSII